MSESGAKENHLNPTSEITLDVILNRAVKGVFVLTGRTFLLSALSLVATGFLTFFLTPSEFGVFWIVSAIVNFLAYFSDIGLAAALIQKKEEVSQDELRTTFTIQQFLVLLILFILFVASPNLSSYYNLSREGEILLYALAFSLFLSSLKTIPSVLLERELNFSKLVIPQVLENLFYNTVAVILAWKGFGIASFTYAVLIRGLVGLIVIYALKPWLPGIALEKKALKRLLSFGIPYQANTFLATIKDDAMTAFLGGILGASGVGLIGWAQKWAYFPLRLFLDHVLKVTFPAFARMQDDPKHLANSITRSIFFVCFLVFPITCGLLIIAPILVEIIPRYDKWKLALIPLTLVCVNTFFAAFTTQLTNLLNAIGKIKITFKLMIMWTVLTWIFVPTLAIRFGVNGAGVGYAIVGVSSLVAVFFAKRYVNFDSVYSIFKPAIGSLVMLIVLLIVRSFLPLKMISVLILVGLGILVYLISMYIMVGVSIIDDAKKGIKAIFSRN